MRVASSDATVWSTHFLIYELWQGQRRHARATVGVSSLVFGVPTIVEAMVSLTT
jgi:hypothetical protein